jgi:hypothetical protein
MSSTLSKTLQKQIVEAALKSLYQDGNITDDDMRNPEQLRVKMLKIIKKHDFTIVIDHRETIIDTARQYKKDKKYDYAVLFYAMFFEHTLNSIIDKCCSRNKIDKKTSNDIIKSVSLAGKLNWLPALLKIPKLNPTHKAVINKTADERNAYTHYKFNPDSEEPLDEREKQQIAYLNKLEKTVTYIKQYESKIIFNNKKGLFKKHIKANHQLK